MHVVFLARRYAPHVGGVERHLTGLIRAMIQQHSELQITVVTEQHDLELPLQEKQGQVTIYRLSLLPNPVKPNLKLSIWAGMKKVLPILSAADCIHVHDVFFWLIPFLPRLIKPKLYITFHGYEVPGPPTLRQRWWHQLAELLTDGNICVGGFHHKWYGVEPTEVTYGAVDSFSPLLGSSRKNKKTLLESQKRKYLFVGRLESDTGIWAYLEAAALAQQSSQATEIAIDVIGDGELRSQLELFVKDERLPVRFLGQQLVTPTTYVGYSASLGSGYLSMLESLSVGTPVIATYTTELKSDYFQLTPFSRWLTIVEPGRQLAMALQSKQGVVADVEQWVKQQTWDKLAGQYQHLWGWGSDE